MDKALEVLKKYYGYSSFREGQEQIIREILEGNDVLTIMPTGGGKSICYQVPALLLEGITIVISPLISLMKDQVDNINNLGIKSAYINSSLSNIEINKYSLEEQAILNVIRINPSIKQEDIAMQINKSLRTVKNYMAEMQKNGIIERKNGKRDGEWVIIKQSED